MTEPDRSLKLDRHTSITIKPGDYALIVTRNEDIRLVTPGFDYSDLDAFLPRLVLGLIVVANKMLEDEWIDGIIDDYFSEPL